MRKLKTGGAVTPGFVGTPRNSFLDESFARTCVPSLFARGKRL